MDAQAPPGESQDLGSSLTNMWIGAILTALGALITVATYLRASPGERYWQMWGLMVLGLAMMIHGYRRARRIRSEESRSRVARTGALCLVVLILSSGGWLGAWLYRAPFWSAVEALSKGNDAAMKLRTIAERHATRFEKGITGPEAVGAWRDAATEAIPLRPDLTAANEAARYLLDQGGAAVRERAESDSRFFPLCLEWLDLYDAIIRQTGQESLAEPPVEWEMRLNDIVSRIQAQRAPPDDEGGT